ncbi:hypothetical protein H650_03680 [Enterobacter sp. R4-368]|nr:hypothetical protein H650_03680 [Enterobacter sp. R4-368]
MDILFSVLKPDSSLPFSSCCLLADDQYWRSAL